MFWDITVPVSPASLSCLRTGGSKEDNPSLVWSPALGEGKTCNRKGPQRLAVKLSVSPALGELRQSCHEFKASLDYTVSSRPVWASLRPCLEQQNKTPYRVHVCQRPGLPCPPGSKHASGCDYTWRQPNMPFRSVIGEVGCYV